MFQKTHFLLFHLNLPSHFPNFILEANWQFVEDKIWGAWTSKQNLPTQKEDRKINWVNTKFSKQLLSNQYYMDWRLGGKVQVIKS